MTVLRNQSPEVERNSSSWQIVPAKQSVDDYARVRGSDARDPECVICLELFEKDATLVELPCRHAFHHDCLAHWLADTNTCPCCRHSMPMIDQLVARNSLQKRR